MLDHEISGFVHLMTRIQQKDVDALVKDSLEPAAGQQNEPQTISIDDFAKVDLRTARILEATDVTDSEKLLCLKVDVGGVEKQIFAGIKGFYEPQTLVGRNIVICANLAPRKMKFGVSEGMVLAAGGDDGLWLIDPGSEVKSGVQVR